MPDAAKIIKDWCASCGMPEPSDGECHALAVAISAAAPVVLPEPERFMDDRGYTVEAEWLKSDEATSDYRNVYAQPLYTEQQVRALLATGGQAQAVDIAELVTGMSVSVDVSTGDDDAGNRYFGTVTVAQEDPHDKHGLTLLVQDAKPNFTPQAQADALDAARLDWLDAQVKHHPVHNGYTWQEGGYEENRGLVCAIQKPKQKQTARQAIDAAIAAAKGSA